METAKVFENGRSQDIWLPKRIRFNADEVIVHRFGKRVVLTAKDDVCETFTRSGSAPDNRTLSTDNS